MLVVDGLKTIRERLLDNGVETQTIKALDEVLQRAQHPAAGGATTGSLMQLVRMLMRTPTASGNPRVYNDLVRLEAEMEEHSAIVREQREREDHRAAPKAKKFYKDKDKSAS